ncbi:predicted protein [Naegleria gruberi]|uniref:Predicted protein n=1 Tax=Naegleria gruberi TaxID=5762 RepID=D2VXG2_NAEGR|nr:uncharacterized protein NAEGRDRAFT_73736 [Naegleria gruberi]EFC38435.1 predicted protein [Naegleria gruberi]|eukprot:XP_002671179.1 predicted protein [Naegleria gruberi strain NEG-M]
MSEDGDVFHPIADDNGYSRPLSSASDTSSARRTKMKKQKVVKKMDENGELRYYNPNTGEDVTEKVLRQKKKKKTSTAENVVETEMKEVQRPSITPPPTVRNHSPIQPSVPDQPTHQLTTQPTQLDETESDYKSPEEDETKTGRKYSPPSHHSQHSQQSETKEVPRHTITPPPTVRNHSTIQPSVSNQPTDKSEKLDETDLDYNQEDETNSGRKHSPPVAEESQDDSGESSVTEPSENGLVKESPMDDLYKESNQPAAALTSGAGGLSAISHNIQSQSNNLWSMSGISKLYRRGLNFVRTFSFVDPQQVPDIKSTKHALFDSSKRNDTEKMTRPILSLHIKGADMLTLDEHLVHPSVKVSVCDITTGQYLRTATLNDKSTEVVLPQMTLPFNMKKTKSLVPVWNDIMYFDTLYNHFLKDNVVFIFELIDFSFEKGEYQIAWGFLRPVSTSGRSNSEKNLRIRLFKYPRKLQQIDWSKLFSRPNQQNTATQPKVPTIEAFQLYQSRDKVKLYPSTLYIEMKAIQRPPKRKVAYPNRPQKPNEIEIGRLTLTELLESNNEEVVNIVQSEEIKEKKKEQSLQRLKVKREINEPCEIPTKLLHQFDSGDKGCLCMEFSKSGQYLACGCHSTDGIGILKIFDIYEGSIMDVLNAHVELIYSIDWNNDDSELITASSDGTVKVWNVEYDKKKSSARKPKLLATFQHPSFVYCAKFHPTCKKLIITGSYDKRIRVFNRETNKIVKELEGHTSRISSVSFDVAGTRMYSASGDGVIKIWSCRLREDSSVEDITNSFACMRTIQDNDLTKSAVTCIRSDPKYSQERIFVHSQDNMLRRLDTGLKNVRNRYHGVKCFINSQKSNISPDGKYLISGSDIGKVYLWNVETEELIFKEGKDYGFEESPVYDIAWSSKEHVIALCSFDGNQPIRVYCFEKPVDQSAEKENHSQVPKTSMPGVAIKTDKPELNNPNLTATNTSNQTVNRNNSLFPFSFGRAKTPDPFKLNLPTPNNSLARPKTSMILKSAKP